MRDAICHSKVGISLQQQYDRDEGSSMLGLLMGVLLPQVTQLGSKGSMPVRRQKHGLKAITAVAQIQEPSVLAARH